MMTAARGISVLNIIHVVMEREIVTVILNARKDIHAAKTTARCSEVSITSMMTAV